MRDQVAKVTWLAAVTWRAACFSLMSTYAAKCAAGHAMESVRLATARRNSDVADVRDNERREKKTIHEYDDDAAYDDMVRALYSNTSDGVASKSQTGIASHSKEEEALKEMEQRMQQRRRKYDNTVRISYSNTTEGEASKSQAGIARHSED